MSADVLHVLLTGRIDAAERDEWLCALRKAAPDFAWWSDNDGDVPRQTIAAAVVANPAPGALAGMSQLRLVQSLWAVLSLHRGFFDYAAQQAVGEWRPQAQRRADDVHVLLLGLGRMGSVAAARLAANLRAPLSHLVDRRRGYRFRR